MEQPWAVAETGGWWVAMWLPFLDCEKCRTLPEPKFPLRENNGRGVRGGVDLADLLLSSSEMAVFDMQRLYPTSPAAKTLSDGAAEAERKQNGIFTLPFFSR